MAKRVCLTALTVIALSLVSFASAYAYGIQYHTVNGISHGCPGDPGCYGSSNFAGDYYRQGVDSSGTIANHLWVSVNDSGGSQTAYNQCWNCSYAPVGYDTNPSWECKFTTLHGAEGPDLAYHLHYTESAIC
ncbi:exported hypothetical protein [Nitrolancea hollandica Lb]|uniref:Uncharacterized protein n=1 Tax=Nitrolancea hollandica Lb TaxID=1129897 RepID=I4EIC4_9BACT|nr:exported hypothetical protein [Nitrolancea hollandica Lb]